MAAAEEIAIDTAWEEMKDLAVEKQQCFYEFLSDCTIYKPDEHKCLKQNIGFAMYGPPTSNDDSSITETNHCHFKPKISNNTDTDVTDSVYYDDKAKKVIDKIYNKICHHSITASQPIYFGIIYIITFRPKMDIKKKAKKGIKEVKKEEAKQATEAATENEGKSFMVTPLPIFTIRRNIEKSFATTSTKQGDVSVQVEADYEIWYIDTNGRVYKSWTDFTKTVNLPKCTMVVPKDGFYQPDPSLPIVEDYSTVWVDIMESPACALKAKILSGMDSVSPLVGVGAWFGMIVALHFMPIVPAVAIAGVVAVNTSTSWISVRSIQQLIDRKKHEESISLLDGEAFGHYLGIVGGVSCLGAIGVWLF